MEFNSISQLLALCDNKKIKISDVMLEFETQNSGQDKELIYKNMDRQLKVMEDAIERGLSENLKSRSGLAGGDAKLLSLYHEKGNHLTGSVVMDALSMALATSEVNSCMGAIVATPTAGSCGVVPGCIFATGKKLNSTRIDLIDALFTAGAIGMVIANNASISGAAGGCQAEIGTASGMAAAAVVQLAGGTPKQSVNAVAIALKSMLGLVCDPVAGLVEVPCIKRNATGSAIALAAADMALAGIESAIPCDEVIDAMYRVGRSIPVTLRETSMGGLATTDTARKFEKDFLGS